MKLPEEERHRRALADANGEPVHPLRDLAALALFTVGLILAVAFVAGHIQITIR